jgi:DNA mismatch repair protein MutS
MLLSQSEGLLLVLSQSLEPLEHRKDTIYTMLKQPAPSHRRDGGYINPHADEELLTLWKLCHDCEDIIRTIEHEQQTQTGLPLSVHYSKLHGFYITIPRSSSDKAPSHYRRTQTLKHEERFTYEALTNLENKILHAQGAMLDREKILYQLLLDTLKNAISFCKSNASILAHIDALTTMARLGEKTHHTLPIFQDHETIVINQGRHPIIEGLVEHFVPNDLFLDTPSRLMLLTGPNMGGKSTFMRQNAVLCVLAYMGAFVPAKEMIIGPIDKIMTRIGAKDEMSKGRSTFMMEMIETAYILHHATPRTLVLMDEVGRGTSTHDGLAIAMACLKALLHENKALTIFATHYFELTENLESGATNHHVAVHENAENVVFLHKILPGPAHKSYGLHVAKLAGIPRRVLEIAASYRNVPPSQDISSPTPNPNPTAMDAIKSDFSTIRTDTLSPIEAHHTLTRLIARLQEDA